MSQLKSWSTRKLKELAESEDDIEPPRAKWWTENGSCQYVNSQAELERVIKYVLEAQDRKERDRL